jgi:outer membrane protein OmpA-like peptidoglycan-associated protein
VIGYGAISGPQPIIVPPQQVYLVPVPVTGQSTKQKGQPKNKPPKVMVQVPPNPQNPIVTPPLAGQPAVPPQQPVAIPPQQPTAIPPMHPGATPTIMSQPVVTPPVIITHAGKNKLHPDTLLRQQTLHNGLAFEKLKPGLRNMQVDVYHGKDASRMLYKDTHVMGKKGFHLTMLGTREPVFIDDLPIPATDVSADFIFYFDFASADIHQDEIKLFDRIIEARKKNKKRIIIMGETDDFGSFEFNKHLAISRSTKIVNALKERGIKDDEIELRIQVRCCRKEHPTKATLAKTRNDRITWVHFE